MIVAPVLKNTCTHVLGLNLSPETAPKYHLFNNNRDLLPNYLIGGAHHLFEFSAHVYSLSDPSVKASKMGRFTPETH